jgi:hypothetical protein
MRSSSCRSSSWNSRLPQRPDLQRQSPNGSAPAHPECHGVWPEYCQRKRPLVCPVPEL